MNQQQQNNDPMQMKDTFNLVYALVHGHSTAITPFLRTSFGKEALGMNGLAALAIILLYGGLMNCYEMFIYLCVWLVAVIYQRVKQFRNRMNGFVQHSRYNGYPALAYKLFPRIQSEGNAKGAEAFLCLGVGWLLTYVSQPLGWFVMAGWVSIMFSEGLGVELRRKKLQAMRDAEIEQQALAEEYRNGRF